ncbi:hypothetical protein [Stigmatella erecta]|uniref:Membrane domain of glycerophosphoryl diester phosphodiesterase n=1 Tax=Stigmatella erecta TaxID=83460 RepID=A0A1I0KVM3_9BACT|nr:hypothetical protein [Stigmatella erecta]SEU29957.1 hypothetical protein SAMN05443639_11522 [Stigmatella erecta]
MPEMDWGGGHQTGAHCALHPEAPAQGTCTRCGNFMCATCMEGGRQSSCPTCRARTGGREFPFTRDTWSLSGLWDYCFEIFKREWVMISVSVLVVLGCTLIAQLVGNVLPMMGQALDSMVLTVGLTVLSFLVQNVVQGLLGLGLMRMLLDVLHGQRADIGRLFSQFHKLGVYFVTLLILFVGIFVLFGILAGILFVIAVPLGTFPSSFDEVAWDSTRLVAAVCVGALSVPVLVYFTLPLYLLQPELAYEEHPSAMQALRNCYAYMRGQRLAAVGFGLMNMVLLLVGLLACCVGFFPALGMSYLLLAALYLSLRSGDAPRG